MGVLKSYFKYSCQFIAQSSFSLKLRSGLIGDLQTKFVTSELRNATLKDNTHRNSAPKAYLDKAFLITWKVPQLSCVWGRFCNATFIPSAAKVDCTSLIENTQNFASVIIFSRTKWLWTGSWDISSWNTSVETFSILTLNIVKSHSTISAWNTSALASSSRWWTWRKHASKPHRTFTTCHSTGELDETSVVYATHFLMVFMGYPQMNWVPNLLASEWSCVAKATLRSRSPPPSPPPVLFFKSSCRIALDYFLNFSQRLFIGVLVVLCLFSPNLKQSS